MSQEQETQPKVESAANNGAATVLGEEALRNLAGFFDVLIQMDLAQKRKTREDGKNDEHATGRARADNSKRGANSTD